MNPRPGKITKPKPQLDDGWSIELDGQDADASRKSFLKELIEKGLGKWKEGAPTLDSALFGWAALELHHFLQGKTKKSFVVTRVGTNWLVGATYDPFLDARVVPAQAQDTSQPLDFTINMKYLCGGTENSTYQLKIYVYQGNRVVYVAMGTAAATKSGAGQWYVVRTTSNPVCQYK